MTKYLVNPEPKLLIPAIVSYVTRKGGYITKTKLLKLLYLCDVEYYRIHRKMLTGFQWRFFHLGPWTREFDPIVEDLVYRGVLIESTSSRPEFETKFFRTSEAIEVGEVFGSYREEAPVKLVLDTWGDSTTGEILDYVYFHTEPMEHGIRNELLDFSRIPEESPPVYFRQASGRTAREIEAARKNFREEMARRKPNTISGFVFTRPLYDEEFFSALSKLDGTDL